MSSKVDLCSVVIAVLYTTLDILRIANKGPDSNTYVVPFKLNHYAIDTTQILAAYLTLKQVLGGEGVIKYQANYYIWFLYAGSSLGMCPANERRRYNVTTSLIGWART